MPPEEIKIGDTFNVRVKVIDKETANIVVNYVDEEDQESSLWIPLQKLAILHPIAPTPKYDPCRLFKKGDKVRYCAPDGRIYADRGSLRKHIRNRDFTHVIRDELGNGRVGVYDPFDAENLYYVPAHALELVTPVEELEPYHLNEVYDIDDGNLIGYEVAQGDARDAIFYGGENHSRTTKQAKEAAEAECARLNAEFRKE